MRALGRTGTHNYVMFVSRISFLHYVLFGTPMSTLPLLRAPRWCISEDAEEPVSVLCEPTQSLEELPPCVRLRGDMPARDVRSPRRQFDVDTRGIGRSAAAQLGQESSSEADASSGSTGSERSFSRSDEEGEEKLVGSGRRTGTTSSLRGARRMKSLPIQGRGGERSSPVRAGIQPSCGRCPGLVKLDADRPLLHR